MKTATLLKPKLKFYLRLALLFLFFNGGAVNIAVAIDWDVIKGEHFKIYYAENKLFAKRALDKAEYYYKKIAEELGYARHDKFWSWSRRVKIYIYPTRDSYSTHIKKQGFAYWAEGIARYKEMEIITYIGSERFYGTILPHEITHLIFRDYVGQKNIPMWIDEGVAQWQEKGKRKLVKMKMRQLLQYHAPLPMERMMVLNINRVENERIVELYYVQAVSMVDFLIRNYGADNFISFCRQLRDGKDINEALRFSYPVSIRSVEELESRWLKYIWGGE